MGYEHCLGRIRQAATTALSDAEIGKIFERIHKAALDIKAGRVEAGADVGGKIGQKTGTGGVIEQAAREAAAQMVFEAERIKHNRQLQLVRMSARARDADGIVDGTRMDALEKTIVRDYSGKTNVTSLEEKMAGYKAYFGRSLSETWNALGKDWFGFFQDKAKVTDLVRELRGEATGNAIAKQGAKAFHDVAEKARTVFNENGGEVGKLDDWGLPQHHSQEKVAAVDQAKWVDAIMPLLNRGKYVDDAGQAWSDATLRRFLGKAYDTISTNGHSNVTPGEFKGAGARANRHAEERQIHFKDAESNIAYWEQFGDKTVFQVLHDHIETMARDIATVEHFGPNPDLTYRTLRDRALQVDVMDNRRKATQMEGRAVKLDRLYDYATGRTKPTANATLSNAADAMANLNVAGKLGGSMIASLFGDKPLMEAVAHLNNLPVFQRWSTELALLNPANGADRRLLQQQGLMLDEVRSGMQRFYEGLGATGTTGKLANAVMRVTGMQAINDIRKGAFGASLFAALGDQIKAGTTFAKLADSDMRVLKNYGITEDVWKTWQQAKLQDIGHGNANALTPDAIARIPGIDEGAKRAAIVKLLGIVNTESEFAIVTPGIKERAAFYGGVQRGTVPGEIWRSFLQFKSFPWAQFQRGMDAIANADGPVGKATMTAFLLASTTLAGAMILQTREMLAGKDPRDMVERDPAKFWGAAFLQGGAMGIYGDFLYSANHTRYGSGVLEAMAGPTVGPLLEMGLTQPMNAIANRMQGKETHLLAQTVQDAKGFIPGGNIWYTKAAMDHLVWQQVMEAMSPGYLASIRSKTAKEFGQEWWWRPGDLAPERGPNLGAAVGQ